MKYAFVSNSVVDLWAEPRCNSERLSQVLYGDVVSLHGVRNGFAQVRERDGYGGWLDKRFLVSCSKPATKPPTGWKPVIVATPTAWFDYQKGGTPTPPYFLFYGTRLFAGRAARGSIKVRMPDGSQRAMGERAVRLLPDQPVFPGHHKFFLEARKFLGVPYLWGGITSFGFDCSGFVRVLFRQFGIDIPRDTKDQIKVGIEISRNKIRQGDLLFFDRHVAVAMRNGRFIHASIGGGGVRINSLRSKDSDYRADLDRDFKTARRLL
jgi:hypothetical protein